SASTSPIVATYPATCFCIAATKLRPLSMQPANRSSSLSVAPLFQSHIALQRLLHGTECLRHPQAWWTQRTPLTAVEDATHRRTIIEHNVQPVRRTGRHHPRASWALALAGLRGDALLQDFAFNASQITDFPTHLHFRVTVQF